MDPVPKTSSAKPVPKASSSSVTLDQLRESEQLSSKVQQRFGLLDSDSDTDSETEVRRRKKSIKSGMVAKPSDRVKARQIWPHVSLKYNVVQKNITFADLNFALMVAGELETISREDITSAERQGRLHLLKQISYYHDSYEWEVLCEYYAAVLRSIEQGIRKWDDNFYDIENMILVHAKVKKGVKEAKGSTSKGVSGGGSSAGPYFCSKFNKNRCLETESHKGQYKGRDVFLQHICGVCFLKDSKKLQHREKTPECPKSQM